MKLLLIITAFACFYNAVAQNSAKAILQCELKLGLGVDTVLTEAKVVEQDLKSGAFLKYAAEIGVESQTLAHNLSVKREENSGIIELTFTHKVKDSAKAILTRIIDTYISYHTEKVFRNIENQLGFTDRAIDQAGLSLHQAKEQMRSSYDNVASAEALEYALNVIQQNFSKIDSELREVRQNLEMYNSLQNLIRQGETTTIPMVLIPLGDTSLRDFCFQWNQLILREKIMQDSTYTEMGFKHRSGVVLNEILSYVSNSILFLESEQKRLSDERLAAGHALRRNSEQLDRVREQERHIQELEQILSELRTQKKKYLIAMSGLRPAINVLRKPH